MTLVQDMLKSGLLKNSGKNLELLKVQGKAGGKRYSPECS